MGRRLIDLAPVHFLLGPGGAGVSTLAAAGALTLAESAPAPKSGPLGLGGVGGTLLVTVDPLSPLPAIFGVFCVPGEPVAVTVDLDLLHLDPLALVESAWRDFTGALGVLGGGVAALPPVAALAGIDAGELTGLPGAEEVLVLRAIRDAATSGRWQRIVVDLSGATDPWALLRAPTVLATAMDRLWPRHRRLAEAAEKPMFAQLSSAIEGIDRDCRDLAELIVDAHSVAVHLVLPGGGRGASLGPSYLALAEVTGVPLRSVLLNAGPGDQSTEAAEAAVRSVLGVDAGSSVSVRGIDAADDPSRMSRLRPLGAALPAPNGRPRGASALRVRDLGGEGLAARYELSWRQSLPDPDRLALGRSGDDLLVTVAGFRQPVRLPSVLRRCLVQGADWDGTRLIVQFAPNPAVWPQR